MLPRWNFDFLRRTAKVAPAFDVQAFLRTSGVAKKIVEYRPGETIFTQGDLCEDVLYVQSGGVKLSVLSKTGKEAVVAMLGPGDFFGEGCLAGQLVRMGSATATTACAILLVRKDRNGSPAARSACDVRPVHRAHAGAQHSHRRGPDRPAVQLQREAAGAHAPAAGALRQAGQADPAVPQISQETLAEIVGTTRSRVNFFLNKFKKLGFIEYNGQRPIKVNNSLLSVVLHD